MIFVQPRRPGGMVLKQARCALLGAFVFAVFLFAVFLPGCFDFELIGAALLIF
jgi:hypothetical protein